MKVLVYTNWPVEFWLVPQGQVDKLREQFPNVTFADTRDDTDALREIADADAALASRLAPQMVRQAGRLKWVHSPAAAVGILPLSDLAARGILVSNSRGIQANTMAEHVMGGLLMIARRLDVAFSAQRERRWIQNELTSADWPGTINGKSMTIVGLGTTGLEVARRAHAFGVRVTGIRRHPERPKPAFADRLAGPGELHAALRGCDILVISAPALAETDCLIGPNEIALLNRGAIIANVARGRIVDQNAMIEALQSGQLGGAVLDVFEHEPLEPSNALWTLPHVIITPHSSGVRPDHWDDVIDLFAENLRRFQCGEPLLNLIDCQAGY